MRLVRAIWHFLVGVKDALVLIAMIGFFGLLYAVLSMSANPKIESGGALLLALDGAIVEQPAAARPLDLLSGGGRGGEFRLRDVVRALDTAASDDRVKAVAIDLDGFGGGGQAALATVGAAMDTVRRAGKPVLIDAGGYDDDAYQLAAHASEVWLDPLGAVLVRGPGGSQLYYKGLLDKLGVTAHVYRVGTFKSAVEPFIRSDQSPAARAANQALADALWSSWQDDVLKARPKAQLAHYMATLATPTAPTYAEQAKADGLVDRLGSRIAFGQRIASLVGQSDKKVPGSFRTIDYDSWVAANPLPTGGPAIGVITVAGDITDSAAAPGTAGGKEIADTLLKALASKDLKALVVRVDSPGGSVTGSHRIRQAILQARAQGLPVVASMGSVAASGGYWVSSAASRIFAEPSTITGSIGVFAILPTFEGTLAKLGLHADGVRATPYSGEPDVLAGTTPAVDAIFQASVAQMYGRFVALVSASRHMTPQHVDSIAQGRVWDGGTARQIGLVDAFGGIDDAIAAAARMAKLDPAKVHAVYIERERPWWMKLVGAASGDGGDADASAADPLSRLAQQPQRILAEALDEAQQVLSGPAIQARCLSCPPVAPPPSPRRSLATLLALRIGQL